MTSWSSKRRHLRQRRREGAGRETQRLSPPLPSQAYLTGKPRDQPSVHDILAFPPALSGTWGHIRTMSPLSSGERRTARVSTIQCRKAANGPSGNEAPAAGIPGCLRDPNRRYVTRPDAPSAKKPPAGESSSDPGDTVTWRGHSSGFDADAYGVVFHAAYASFSKHYSCT